MSIRIIEEAPIYMTAGELQRLRREYEQECYYRVDPPIFEEWVRARHASQQEPPCPTPGS